MKNELKRIWAKVEHFFFQPEVPYGLAMVRILFPIIMMGMVLPRWHVAREIFSTDGAIAQLALGYGFPNWVPEFSGTPVVAMYGIMIAALVCASIGWCTRASLIISCVLFTYFTLLDYVSTMTKYTVITTHILAILSVSECGSLWSVDAWLKGRKRLNWPGQPAVEYQRFPCWPRRLMQIFIGVVYFGAALTKMHTPLFFTGDMLQFWMQTHINFRHPIGEYLSLYPIFLVACAYITIIWEVAFLFVCWKGRARGLTLAIGIAFHFMTTLTLGLMLFPMVCYCTYLSFIDEEDVRDGAARIRRLVRQSPRTKRFLATVHAWRARLGNPVGWQTSARAAFVFSLALVAVINVEAEHWLDLYGERRPEGRYALTPMDPAEAARMLAPTEPYRLADKFFAIDTGSILVGDRLANRRSEFRQGERLIAQCCLTPPHEDMFLECKLQDNNNRIVDRLTVIATREMFRTNFNYILNETTPPGEYSLVIEAAGRPVIRKGFRVVGMGGAAAN